MKYVKQPNLDLKTLSLSLLTSSLSTSNIKRELLKKKKICIHNQAVFFTEANQKKLY